MFNIITGLWYLDKDSQTKKYLHVCGNDNDNFLAKKVATAKFKLICSPEKTVGGGRGEGDTQDFSITEINNCIEHFN